LRNTYNKRLAPFFSAAGATQKKTGAKRQNVGSNNDKTNSHKKKEISNDFQT
jgi:hypothetical protein